MAFRPSLNIHSVFLKLIAVIVAALIGVVLVFEILTTRGFETVISQSVFDSARSETELFADAIAGSVRFEDAELMTRQIEDFTEGTNGALVSLEVFGSGLSSFSQWGASMPAATRALVEEALDTGRVVLDPDALMVAIPLRFGQDRAIVGSLVTQWSTAHLQALTQETVSQARKAAAILCLFSVALAYIAISRLARRPLQAAQADIARLEAKDFETPPSGTARRDEYGHLARATDALRHELMASERSHRESYIKSAALDNSSAAVMLLDEDLTITQVSRNLTAFFEIYKDGLRKMRMNFDPARVVGMSIADFHPTGNIADQLRTLGDGVIEGIIRMNSKRLSIATRTIYSENRKILGYIVEWRDVTPMWRNEALLAAIDAIQMKAEFDMDGICVDANERFAVSICSGRTDRPSLQTLIARIAADADKTTEAVIHGLKNGSPIIGQLKLSGADGDRIVDGSLSCIRDKDGHGLSYLLLGTDITEKEHKLRIADQEREASEAEKTEVVQALGVGLRALADGDLTAKIAQVFPGRYEQLRTDFNGASEKLASALREISENAENIRNETSDITTTADALSRRTESTAATLEQTAAALDELTSALKAAADGASRANDVVGEAHRSAEASGAVVVETVSAMDEISRSSEQITSIIRVIDDIAFQTNLLALNAGVEAARAGEAGRGFAVVASEVRALAQRSSDAAREINSLIADSAGQVKKGVDLVGQTGGALRQIAFSVTEIAGLVSEIAESSRTQSLSLEEINASVTQLDQSTQQNAARLEETTAASEALRNDAVTLVETVSRFKTGASVRIPSAEASPAPPARAVVNAPAREFVSEEGAKWLDF